MLSAAATHARLQLAFFAAYRNHGCITDRDGNALDLEADHRRHAEIENAIRDLKYGVGLNHLPYRRRRCPADSVMIFNLRLCIEWLTARGLRSPRPTRSAYTSRLA